MTARIARLVVRASAALASRDARDRWREEWLAEIDVAAGRDDRGSRPSGRRVLVRSLGAPWDALMTRRPRPRLAGEVSGTVWRGWRSDVKQALRLVVRAPWQTITTVLCLGVGLAACTTVFSILNALVWGERPGIQDRSSLSQVHVQVHLPGFAPTLNAGSTRQYDEALRTPPAPVAGVAAEGTANLSVRLGDETASVNAAFVSGNYFNVLGTSTDLGRLIAPDDETSAQPVVVVSRTFWRTQLGGTDDAVGRTIVVGDRSLQVIGVAPERFSGWAEPDIERGRSGIQIWLPLSETHGWPGLPARDDVWLTAIARHAAGVSRAQAEQALRGVETTLAALGPPRNAEHRHSVRLAALGQPPGSGPAELLAAMAAVLAAPLAVLLIGCANVANLRLARATERTRELAVRLSLGASRWQITRMLIVEIGIVAALATLAGWAGSRVMLAQVAGLLPFPVMLDARVAVFSSALAAGVVVLSGLAPSWLVAGRLLTAGLRQTAQAGGLAHARLRNVLVGGQVALSIVLLVTGALFARSTALLLDSIPTVAAQLIVAELNLKSAGHDGASATVFARDLLNRLEREPRVRAAAVMDAPLLRGSYASWRTQRDPPDQWPRVVNIQRVSGAWFDAVDARLLAGRLPAAGDRPASAVVINETLARGMAIGGPAIGQTVSLRMTPDLADALAGASPAPRAPSAPAIPGVGVKGPARVTLPVEIVGVVTDTIEHPRNVARGRSEPRMYVTLAGEVPLSATLLVRAESPEWLLEGGLQRIIAATNPRAPWTQIETARTLLVREFGETLYFGLSVVGLGVVSLGLAMAGLYAIMVYVVSLRTREIGIRVALGARPGQVVALIVSHALRVVGAGAGVGLLVSVPVAYGLRAMFIGISPADPVAALSTVALLAVTALVASLLPARRAARVDPIQAIRED